MFRAFRSRAVALSVLAIFLLAQPTVGCAALCLFEPHGTAHAMPGMDGKGNTAAADCHAGGAGVLTSVTIPGPSPMTTASAPAVALAPEMRAEAVRQVPTEVSPVTPAVDPPPPRLV